MRGWVERWGRYADPLVSHAHVGLCWGGSHAGSGLLAQGAGVQAHLLANDHVHGLGVGLPQAWHRPCLHHLHHLPPPQQLSLHPYQA